MNVLATYSGHFHFTGVDLVAIVVAFFTVYAAARYGLGAAKSHGAAKLMRLTETSTTGSVRELYEAAKDSADYIGFARPVELVGTVEPGPHGLLTSPLSETKCVWHRRLLTERYIGVSTDSDGDRTESELDRTLSDECSGEPFLLRDSEGVITVVPSTVVIEAQQTFSEYRNEDEPEKSLKIGTFELKVANRHARGEVVGHGFEEWVLTAGTRVFVCGEASDHVGDLAVMKYGNAESTMVISTRDEADEISSHRSSMWRGIAMAIVLLVISMAALAIPLSHIS